MAWGGPPQSAFATFLILCSTSFFLGILFSLFPYDYPLLWKPSPCPPSAFENMERHLKVLHESPLLIPRILHTVVGTGLLGFFLKLYKPSESNALFDGASLVLYMVALIIYLANTIPGLREVTSGSYDMEIVGGEGAIGNKDIKPGEEKPLGKADSLRVLAASNTIQALVLLGVLVLQAGQWYADRKQREEMEESAKERETRAGKSEGGKHRSPVGKKKV